MADLTEIKKKIIEIVGANANLPIKGIVKTIDVNSCSVEINDDLIVTDVKLKATLNESENYFQVVPKVGSKVLIISLTGDLDNLSIIKVDEVERFEFKQEGLEFLLDSSDKKVMIKNGEVSLIDVFTNLSTLLKQFKVFTPSGPSGTPLPNTVTQIEGLEEDFNKLLK